MKVKSAHFIQVLCKHSSVYTQLASQMITGLHTSLNPIMHNKMSTESCPLLAVEHNSLQDENFLVSILLVIGVQRLCARRKLKLLFCYFRQFTLLLMAISLKLYSAYFLNFDSLYDHRNQKKTEIRFNLTILSQVARLNLSRKIYYTGSLVYRQSSRRPPVYLLIKWQQQQDAGMLK